MLSTPITSRRRMLLASSWKLSTKLRWKKSREHAVPRLREGRPLNRPVERPAHRLCHPLYPIGVAHWRGQCHPGVRRGSPSRFPVGAQPSRDLDPEFVALHRTITGCRARILDRGTGVASYNEAKVLALHG
jgi:hypothetical protein